MSVSTSKTLSVSSNHDIESNVFFSSVPHDDEETDNEPERSVEHVVRANCEADDLMTVYGVKPWILRQSKA